MGFDLLIVFINKIKQVYQDHDKIEDFIILLDRLYNRSRAQFPPSHHSPIK